MGPSTVHRLHEISSPFPKHVRRTTILISDTCQHLDYPRIQLLSVYQVVSSMHPRGLTVGPVLVKECPNLFSLRSIQSSLAWRPSLC